MGATANAVYMPSPAMSAGTISKNSDTMSASNNGTLFAEATERKLCGVTVLADEGAEHLLLYYNYLAIKQRHFVHVD